MSLRRFAVCGSLLSALAVLTPAGAAPLVADSVMARASALVEKWFDLGDSTWKYRSFYGDFMYGDYWNSIYRSYCQFDISRVPDSATADSATLAFYQYNEYGLDVVRVCWLECLTPGQMSLPQLWAHIDTGAAQAAAANAANGWVAARFNAAGLESLNLAISRHQDSVMLGFKGTGGYAKAWGCTSALRPRLRLYYSVSAVAEHSPPKPLPRFRLSPNPASGRMVTVELPTRDAAILTIYDPSGREARPSAFSSQRPAVTLDLRDLRPGVYLVRLSAGGLAATEKLLLLR